MTNKLKDKMEPFFRDGEAWCFKKSDVRDAVIELKNHLNPAYENKYYQEWVKLKGSNEYIPEFRKWVVDNIFEDATRE